MKSQGEENTDDDCFDDPIRLNFGENTPHLEKIQFLDPGIIDLDCDSDEDCSIVSENPDDFNTSRITATHHILPTVTSPISNTDCIKPMIIKIVDCYKFPWFFDQSTKEIIEKKLFINKNVNNNTMSNEEMNVDSEEFKNVSDTHCVNDGNYTGMFIFEAINNKNVNNNLSGQIMDGSCNEHININNKCANGTDDNKKGICFDKRVHNYTDTKSVRKIFGTKMRVVNRKKQLENYNKRNDMEKQRAINQRNKTTVDIKKNTGLVGMKIQQITCEKQKMNMKEPIKNVAQTSKEKNLQKTLDKLYVKAVDKVLINIGTTITPVFDEIKGCANESGRSQCVYQNVHEDSIVKSINRNGEKKYTLDIEKKAKELNHAPRQRGNLENEKMMEFINGSKMIAEEIVRLNTPNGKGIGQVNKKQKSKGDTIKVCNEIHTAKKTENQNAKEHTEGNHSSSKKQKLFDDSKITKTIASMPFSLKTYSKEKNKSVRSAKTIETCEKKEYVPPKVPTSYPHKKNTDIKSKHNQINCSQETDKHTLSSQRSGCHVKNKWFPTLNRYTKNILNKIKAKQHKQYKINVPNISHKRHSKKTSNFVQSKSEECKSMLSIVNVTKDVPIDDKIVKNVGLCTNSLDQSVKNNSVTKINDVKNTMSPKISKTQQQYSNKNQVKDLPNTNKCHPKIHHVQHHMKQPLNSSFVKPAKADYETNNIVPVSEENTQPIKTDNKISSNQHINITENPLIEEQAGLKQKIQVTKMEIVKDIKNFENIINHEENLKVSTQQTNTSNLKDKFSIHAIVKSQNESDLRKHINTQRVNLTDRNFLPNTPCSASIKGTTQTQNHQAKVTNKPSTFYNSMQTQILYRPLDGNSQPPQIFSNNSVFQVPKQHIDQSIYRQLGNHQQYPPSYTEEISPNNIMSINARLHSEVNEGIPPQTNMNIRPSLEGNRGISPQMAFDTRPHAAENGLSPSQSTTINLRYSGINGGITPQVESNARLMSARVKCGIPPLMTFNIPSPGDIARMSSQMPINDSTAGVNGDIPPQMARNDRPIASSVSDMLSSKIVWSYAFPPPDPPPPPPPPPPLPPSSQEIPGFPIQSQDDSSIIGKNNDGIIKKINITAPVIDQNTETYSKKSHIVENIHSVSTPLYDEIATVDSYENSVSKIIKSEIMQESDDIHRMLSPVKYSTSTHQKSTAGILCNLPAESYDCPTIPRSSPQSNAEQIDIVKKEKAGPRVTDKKNKTTIPVATTDTCVTYVFNSKSVLSDKCHESGVHNLKNPFDVYEGSKNCKKFTSADKPSINRLTNSKAPQIKPNESSTTSSTRIQPQPIAQLTENNPRSVGNTKNTTSKEVTHSKTPPIEYKKKIKPSTKKLPTHIFEDSTRLTINSKKTDSDSVNLKRTQPSIDDAKNAPPVKYRPGPLSKKIQIHNQKQKEKDSPGKTKREQVLPSKGYSAPILPIPTYESFISYVPDLCNKLSHRPVEKSNKPFDQSYSRKKETCSMSLDELPRNQSSKVDRTKKISLDEYKKKRLVNERKKQEDMAYFDTKKDISSKNNTIDMPRWASNVESDLGYDSDSTVILQRPL